MVAKAIGGLRPRAAAIAANSKRIAGITSIVVSANSKKSSIGGVVITNNQQSIVRQASSVSVGSNVNITQSNSTSTSVIQVTFNNRGVGGFTPGPGKGVL